MDELIEQTKLSLENKKISSKNFTKQIAFNAIPHIDVFVDEGYTKEEVKIVDEGEYRAMEAVNRQLDALRTVSDALFLSAGKLSREVVDPVFHVDGSERHHDAIVPLFSSHPQQRQRKLHILIRRENGDQMIELKNVPDVAGAPSGEAADAHSRDVFPSDDNLASAGSVDAGYQIQKRGLAASGGTHEGHGFTLLYIERDRVEGFHLDASLAVPLRNVTNLNHGCQKSPCI